MFDVAIPSYKRPELFRTKTYELLVSSDLLEKTTVFVVAEEEAAYRAAFPNLKIVVGKLGLISQLRFIYSYYPEGTRVLRLDDDVECLIDITGAVVRDIRPTVEKGFTLCEAVGARIWGIYPVTNPFFMKNDVTYDLRHLLGCFNGYIKKGAYPAASEDWMDYKEDYYTTCAYYETDKVIVRINNIAPKTKFMRGDSLVPTKDNHERCADKIVQDFPKYATKYYRKTTGIAEIRLRRFSQ